jgi:hypothetical protein
MLKHDELCTAHICYSLETLSPSRWCHHIVLPLQTVFAPACRNYSSGQASYPCAALLTLCLLQIVYNRFVVSLPDYELSLQ